MLSHPTDFQPGIPIDRRPPQRVAKLQSGPVGDFEAMAARVVARLTGERVILQDDGSRNSMPDICIEYADHPPGYVEVSADIDPKYAEIYSLLMKKQNQLPYVWPDPRLHRAWQVTISGSTRLDRLEGELVDLLAQLESAGETFEHVRRSETLVSNPNPSVVRLLELGIVMLGSGPANEGVIRLYTDGIRGPAILSWDPVLDWIRTKLSSPELHDVRRKLSETGAAERHVFLGPTYSSPSHVFFSLSLEETSLPQEVPMLPPELTHLWMMTTPSAGRSIAWFPDRGWFNPAFQWATD